MPRRTSSWSSATRMRSFFAPLVIYWYRNAHRRAAAAGFNIELSGNQRHSLVHAGDANAKSKRRFPIPSPHASGNTTAFVAYLQCDLSRVTLNAYLGLETSRMSLDIRETFLNNTEKSQFDMWLHPPGLLSSPTLMVVVSPFGR